MSQESQSEDNSEITNLAEQDQNERGEYLEAPSPERWQQILEHDKVRRIRTIAIMNENKLQTANDYFHAGLVMIHGDTTEDALYSHVFAMTAMTKGHRHAPWLSAISLDWMLQGLEQGQAFDTYPPVRDVDTEHTNPPRKLVFLPESIKTIFKAINDE